MKIFAITLGGILLIFIIIQLFAMSSRQKTETYPYTVIKKYDAFEVRSYEATLFSTVELSGNSYKSASGEGFSILAGYIFGGNDNSEKIAMTSPVAMALEDTMTMMFMVPKKFKKETLPKPNESKIEFREEPAKTVAAITFGGWSSDELIAQYKQQLKNALDAEGIKYTNQFFFLGYNPPFEVFNRKNEVIVELVK